MVSSKKLIWLCLLLAVSTTNGFRFQPDAQDPVTKEVDETKVEKASVEYEDIEEPKATREERKIDPLVVDVERKPLEEKTEEALEGKQVSEEVEGRFFLKDKLCALGLADVSN